ncbi:MAG: TetR/AcrR family transcriptional regulator [Treponema sp.]|nr:TetR/AcrR family transcriptional regulator [Treponema sp.]
MQNEHTEAGDNSREQLILDSACREFLKHGKNGARMQKIADGAEVNKALVYYYYHSKNQIFQAVIERNFTLLISSMTNNIDFTASVKNIIRQFIHNHLNLITTNPEIFQFFSGEIWMNPKDLTTGISSTLKNETKKLYTMLSKRLKQAAEKREIRNLNPLHFLFNIISLDVFFFIAAPIIFPLTGTLPSEQKKMTAEREKEVFDFIWESIRCHENDKTDAGKMSGEQNGSEATA